MEGLLDAVEYPESTIRRHAGLALEAIKDRLPDLTIPSERVMKVVLCELDSNCGKEAVRLLHVFRLLSLVFPKGPLRVAYHVLLADDSHFNGTAVEYLETVLPPEVWSRMRKLIEADKFREGVA